MPSCTRNEAQWIIDNAQARWAFVTADVAPGPFGGLERQIDIETPAYGALLQACAAPLVERAPDDVAWLFYTSGTTGRPKGVMLTHRNLMTMGLTYFVDVDPIAPQDAIVYAAPMSHGAGIYAIPHLMAGARHVVPVSGGVDPDELFALAREAGPLSMFAAPTIVKRLVDHAEARRRDWRRLQDHRLWWRAHVRGRHRARTACDGAALRADLRSGRDTDGRHRAVARAPGRHRPSRATRQRIASVGVAQTPVQVRVADSVGQDLPAGEVGEVLVRGDTVMAGYWRNPEATAAAVRDGWLWTGDMGALDADGFLTLKDRSKDLIISGGSNIYPREVEEVLLSAPGVAEVAVVGAADPEWGEVVVAFVVPQPGTTLEAAALDAHCLAQIARFKRPKRYEIVDGLPKNNYGKVLKTELRRRLVGG